MATYYTANLNADIDNYLRDQDNALKGLPRCSECGEPIQDDYLYMIGDDFICESCLTLNHRRFTDEFMS